MIYYRLEDRLPVVEEDFLNWASWLGYADRRVAQTDVGPLRVSTVFLGIDHAWRRGPDDRAPPILFETLVFGGEPMVFNGCVLDANDIAGRRYATWDEATAGHAAFVAWATAKLAGLDVTEALQRLETKT